MPRIRRTAATTSCDVMPRGLSRLRMPLSMRRITFRRFYRRLREEVMQEARDSDAVGNRRIELKSKFWGIAQFQVFAKLPTDKASGMLKPLECSALFGFTAYPADINTRVTQIGGHVDSR